MANRIKYQTVRRKTKKRPNGTCLCQNSDALLAIWAWFFGDASVFSKIAFHGNIKWNPIQLVVLAVHLVWSDASRIVDSFTHASEACRILYGKSPVATYQGLMNALLSWSSKLLPLALNLHHQRMREVGGKHWEFAGWVPIAIDGSRASVPRTKSNESAFCARNYGKGRTAKYRKKPVKGMRYPNPVHPKPADPKPQVWITMLVHIGLCLPWSWRLGPSNSNERDHALEEIKTGKFPKNTLFCKDAGFVGYEYWKEFLNMPYHFLVRAGANAFLVVDLPEKKKLRKNRDQIVWCWPKGEMESGKPLRLRLIHTTIGKAKVWIITNVLNRKALSIRQAQRLYAMRWSVELEFRGLKQTMERTDLRCQNSKRVLVELDWSIFGMAMAELFAIREMHEARAEDLSKRSLAKSMRALRWSMRNLREFEEPGGRLKDQLRVAVADSYERTTSKKARYRPNNPDKKRLGDPKLRLLTREELAKLRNLEAASKT